MSKLVSMQIMEQLDKLLLSVPEMQGISRVFLSRDCSLLARPILPQLSGEGEQSLAGKSLSIRGFGLGLAIVKELAKLHGGAVSADSTQGKGTTLTVTFPSIGTYR